VLATRKLDRGGKRGSELLRWTDPREAPRVIAALDGVVNGLVPDPRGARVGLSIVYPKEAVTLSSDDPHAFAVLDLATGALTRLFAGVGFGFGDAATFAPDGARVALADHGSTRVYDVASGRNLARSAAALELAPLRWEPAGLVLVHLQFAKPGSDAEPAVSRYRWQPGKGDPRPVTLPGLRSPDGRYTLDTLADAVTITGPDGVQRLALSRPEDRAAFRALRDGESPRWLGPTQVVVTLDEPMALDLPTGKLHYLFPLRGLRWAACSPDGRLLVARDDDDRYVWAQR
jgi:hypothetical protein